MTDTARSEPIVNALTVDVEDYFQVSAFELVVGQARWEQYERRVASNTSRLLDIFAEASVKATFFVLGWVAEREPALVRRIASEGHEVASHGFWHRLVYSQTPQEFRADIRASKAALESITGQLVLGYRAPSFSITKQSLWALDVLVEEGFAYDASIFPIRHDRYGIPSAPRHAFIVKSPSARDSSPVGTDVSAEGGLFAARHGQLIEVPASTIRIAGANLPIAGGGYFRLLPYFWTRWGISRVNRIERKPVVFYIHPWEVDADQPRIAAPFSRRLRHYTNLQETEGRLRRLLRGGAYFGSMSRVLLSAESRAQFEALG
jgi:polysaccharide deacetylase family protein (PEP-CTERM system associated)